jgi:hypothetical protein
LVGCSSEASKAAKALRQLPDSAAPAQVSVACGQLQKLGPIPDDLKGRCGGAFVAQGQALLAQGKADVGADLLGRAVALGIAQKTADDAKAAGQAAWVAGEPARRAKAEQDARASAAAKKAADAATAKKTAADQAAALKAGAALRRSQESVLRDHFLDQGMDIKVKVSGENATVVTLTYILFSDVWAHKLKKSGGLADQLFDMGFKRIYLKDGNDYNTYIYRK